MNERAGGLILGKRSRTKTERKVEERKRGKQIRYKRGCGVQRKRVKKGRRGACDVRRSERRCPAKEERDEKEKAESITI